MSITFWLVANLALLLAFVHLVSASRVRAAYRPLDSSVPIERPPISLLAVLDEAHLEQGERVDQLLAATRKDDQLVLLVRGANGRRYRLEQVLERLEAVRGVSVVSAHATPGGGDEAQVFEAASRRADHALVAFVDENIEIAAANLDEGARLLSPTSIGVTGTGGTFAFPYAREALTLGDAAVAAHHNATLLPHLAALGLRGTPRIVLPGFWMATRNALDAAASAPRRTAEVSLSSWVGHRLRASRQRVRPLRRPVPAALERLRPADGMRRVMTSLRDLRALGLGLFSGLAITWNPLGLVMAAAILGLASGSVPVSAVIALVLLVALLRAASVVVLNAGFYRLTPVTRFLASTLLFEALVAPWLFLAVAVRGDEH